MNDVILPRPLPARAAPLPGESLFSVVRRTSQVMGYESPRRLVGLLASQSQLPAHLNQLAPGPVFRFLAALLNQSTETILPLTFHRHAPSLVVVRKGHHASSSCDSKTILKYYSSPGPVCPNCLRRDDVAYERLLWSFRPIPVCTECGTLLAGRCPACGRSIRTDRHHTARCGCGKDLCKIDAPGSSAAGRRLAGLFERTLLERISPLPRMSPAACFWWAERLAGAILKTPDWTAAAAERLELPPTLLDDSVAWLAAAELLEDWPAKLSEFLEAFQRIDKHKTTSTGVGRRFGMLLRHAAWLEEMGFATPADTLRQYLLEHYDGGHLSGKVCLFKNRKDRATLGRRAWVPQTTAAKILGVRQAAIGPLVERGVLTGKLHSAGANGRTVGLVLRKSVDTLRHDLSTAIDVNSASQRLGIGRHAVLDLIHNETLPRAVRTTRGWRIPRPSVAALESLCQGLPRTDRPSPRWLSLRQATRQYGPSGLALARLIDLLQTGQIRARMVNAEASLNGIVVSGYDLATKLPLVRELRDRESGYSVHRLCKVLVPGRHVKATVLKKWIRMGLLTASRSGRAMVVSDQEVEHFRSQYCLADEACRLLNVHRSTLARWEAEGRVRPVYGKRVTPGAGFSVYRREDLTHLTRHREPGRST